MALPMSAHLSRQMSTLMHAQQRMPPSKASKHAPLKCNYLTADTKKPIQGCETYFIDMLYDFIHIGEPL